MKMKDEKGKRLFLENWFCQEDHTVPKLHCLVCVEQSLKAYVPLLRVFVVHVQILIFLIFQTNKQAKTKACAFKVHGKP